MVVDTESHTAQDAPGGLVPGAERMEVQVDAGALSVRIPPAGMSLAELGRAVALSVGAGAALYFALAMCTAPAWVVPRVLGILGGLTLLAYGATISLRSTLDRTHVRATDDALHVVHTFPWPSRETILRDEFRGIVIGRARLLRRGYCSRQWPPGRLELVALGSAGTAVQFGAGLPEADQVRLRQLIEDLLPPRPRGAPAGTGGRAPSVQPPELFWLDITRCCSYLLVSALLLVGVLLAARSPAETTALALVVVIFSGTAAVLGYRNYRLERTASRWHSAVIRSFAGIMELDFSPDDVTGVALQLPDFAFFRGPRRIYNVAWNDADPHDLVAFDYTSASHWRDRDGVGCALRVDGVGEECLSFRPRGFPRALFARGNVDLRDYPLLAEHYTVTDCGREGAGRLLDVAFVDVLCDWSGASPRPWVCIAGSVLGLSIPRRQAEHDRTLRDFYGYARHLRQTLEDRLLS
jgi:hypothetical protein